MMETRRLYLSSVRSIVLKLGTQLLTAKTSGPDKVLNAPVASPAAVGGETRAHSSLDEQYLDCVARQVVALRQRGIVVTIVSSGAIGAGVRELKLDGRPTDLGRLQAVAAVGQRCLMDAWGAAFAAYTLPVAQLLLTREDIDDRTRFLNVRNTINAVHELGAVPIINENDTISTDELVKITFGDNDILAALVAQALQANLLVLMSIVDGLLDAESKPVRLVGNLAQAQQLVRAEKSALGKGGMDSKLAAARMVTGAGDAMVVVDGRMPSVLTRLLDCEPVGTLFVPAQRRRSSRSRWIGSVRTLGAIVVDDGAVQALVEKNRSLLAAGIVAVEGSFDRGDCVAIKSTDGSMVARGLSNYAAVDVHNIRGKKTSQIRDLLGEAAYDEVIHRDNLVIEQALL